MSESFDNLPAFDARKFQPPAWASGSGFQWGGKNGGESSKGTVTDNPPRADDDDDGEEDDEDEQEVWEDARSVVEPDEAVFTVTDLRDLLARAAKYKVQGNAAFTSKPPAYDEAITAYQSAIDHLPSCPRKEVESRPEASGIAEVTEEEAEAIQVENRKTSSAEENEREEVEEEIRELTKACWGNMAACHVAMKDDRKAVKACDNALDIDPKYTKALHRRATANERIGSATALSSAQEDYKTLLALLPLSSPQLPTIKQSLATIPTRLQEQQQKEMSEALGQLKELGNKFLGTFGLSTDMFKMDKAADGSYSMKFGS